MRELRTSTTGGNRRRRAASGGHWVYAVLCVWAVAMALLLCFLLLVLVHRNRAEAEKGKENGSETVTEADADIRTEEAAEDRKLAAVWTGEKTEAESAGAVEAAEAAGETGTIWETGTVWEPGDLPENAETFPEELQKTAGREPEGDAPEEELSQDNGAAEAADGGEEAERKSVFSGLRDGLAGMISERIGSRISGDGTSRTSDASEAQPQDAADGSGEEQQGSLDTAAGPSVRNLIVDLDYNSDVDDVCALAVAAQLHCEGRIKLLGVTLSTSGEDPVRAAHAQLRYYGLGDIPIGRASVEVTNGSPYWWDLINAYYDGSDLAELDAVDLIKRKLRECALAGVRARIVTTGYLTNIAALLQDQEGYLLVRDHVEDIYITGGIWRQGGDHNFVYQQPCRDAAVYLQEHSPVPLIYSTSMSVNNDRDEWMMVGGRMLQRDTAGRNPVTIAFRAYERENEASLAAGRFAWDPMCIFVAALEEPETRTHLEPCHIYIHAEDGNNVFSPERADYNCQVIHRDTDDLGWYQWMIEEIIDATLRE